MGVFTFVCKGSGSEWSTELLNGDLEASANCIFNHHSPPPTTLASAFSIAGPKEWLKQQKKKSAKFLFVLVDASRNILQSAYLLLMKTEAEFGENDMEEVQKLLVFAARDSVPQDRNSFVEFQANTRVEECL